jgi:hypothetical protein
VSALRHISETWPWSPPSGGDPPKSLDRYPFPGNTAAGAINPSLSPAQIGNSEYGWEQEAFQAAQLFRKPSGREGAVSGFHAQTLALLRENYKQAAAELQQLRSKYVFRNSSDIAQFLSDHRGAGATLIGALEQLQESFGPDVILNLEATREDDESLSLYAIVVWRGTVEGAERALEDFDERWWLNQAPQGRLTFTYELA